MKIMNVVRKFGSKCVEVVKNTSKSVKALIVGAGATVATTSAKAAVTFDGATKSFAGEFDLAPYYSAIGIVIGAIAVIAAIGLALRQFKRV